MPRIPHRLRFVNRLPLQPHETCITLQPMIRILVLGVLTVLTALAADDLAKPEKLTLHTWVREDIFAGWMAYDAARLELGARKVDRFLQDQPDNASALSWKYLELTYRMRDARKKNDQEAYRRHLAAANEIRKRVVAKEPNNPVPGIIIGGSLVFGALYMPEEDREWMYREGRTLLRKVPELQGPVFDKLPPHMRGELWSLIAFASDRLGDKPDRDHYVDEMLTKLAGSPYEARAKRWKNQPSLTNEVDNMCITCHEPGRLAAVQSRNNAAK
jgi:hypothetical protein